MTVVTTMIFTFTIASLPTERYGIGKQGFQKMETSDYRSSRRDGGKAERDISHQYVFACLTGQAGERK